MLISPFEVLNNIAGQGNDALSEDIVIHCIEIAEERFVRTALGWDLYEELVAAKNQVVTLSNIVALQALMNAQQDGVVLKEGDVINASEFLFGWQLDLWNNRLCKYVSECVRFISIGQSYTQLTNSGIMKNNPVIPGFGSSSGSSSGSAELKDMKFILDDAMNNRITPLQITLQEYLCKNIEYFPSYDKDCVKCKKKPELKAKVDFLLDVYDDPSERRCCDEETVAPVGPILPTRGVFTKYWLTTEGQTEYPDPSLPANEREAIKQELKGAYLTALTKEGQNMFPESEADGQDDGNLFIGIDPSTGVIKWKTPAAMAGIRMEANLYR